MARRRADGTRQTANHEDGRADNGIAAILESLDAHVDEEKFSRAKLFLAEKLKRPESEEPKALFERLVSAGTLHSLVMVSQQKRLQALDLIYATVEMVASSANPEELIEIAREKANANRRINADPVSFFARCVIKYGDEDEKGRLDPEARRAWNRDAKAVHFVRHQHVPVGGIVAYQQENGGGVETWARAWSSTDKAPKQKPINDEGAADPKSAVAPGPLLSDSADKLLGHLEDGDSAVLLVTRLNGTLACQDHATVASDFKNGSTWNAIKLAAATSGVP